MVSFLFFKPWNNIEYLISLVSITNGNFLINLQGTLSCFAIKKSIELKGNIFIKCHIIKLLLKWREKENIKLKI